MKLAYCALWQPYYVVSSHVARILNMSPYYNPTTQRQFNGGPPLRRMDTGVMHCGDEQYGLRTTNMNVTLRK